MKLSRAAIALYVGLIFASGAVLGVFGQRLYNATIVSAKATRPNPEDVRKRNVDEARERVHLTDDQVQKLNLILDETSARMNELHEKGKPERLAIYQNQIDRVNAILTPDQQVLYEQMRKERQEKQKDWQKRGGGRPGPGL